MIVRDEWVENQSDRMHVLGKAYHMNLELTLL